jgi:hypothetical protein
VSLLAIEPLIVARLAERVPGARAMTAEDVAELEDKELPAPSLHVIYAGLRVRETSPTGMQALTEQTWLVVAVIKQAGDRGAAERQQRVKPWVDGALAALMGWRPAQNMRPLRLVSSPGPRWRAPYYYFPLAFAADVPVQGDKP